jgi:BlaI family transcriptional regulator, penicillinase repressor
MSKPAGKSAGVLTPQELAIMKVVWRLSAATVRDVYEALRTERVIAYTTVMTMMNVLEEKGHLRKGRVTARTRGESRVADGRAERAFEYRPTRARQQVLATMVRDFVARVLDGAAEPLLLHLARTERFTEEQRRELRRLIDESEPRKPRA